MIHFLRNKKNKTIIETEIFGYDSSGFYLNILSSISPKIYGEELIHIYELASKFLFAEDPYDFMQDIHELNELKELYHNKYLNMSENEFNNIVKDKYKTVAEKYNLRYVTD